jgi:DNA repair protein RadD
VLIRDYQDNAIKNAITAAKGGAKRITIASPVGSGKSVIIAELARRAKRPIIISPSRTLLTQLHGNMERWLGERVGVEQGVTRVEDIVGLKERVAVCMRQSMLSRDRYKRRAFDGTTLVIVDECHLGNTKPFTQMMRHFEEMGAVAIGLSATPYKGKGKPLPFWDRPCFSYSLLDAIKDLSLIHI